jgi:hypothetical protein
MKGIRLMKTYGYKNNIETYIQTSSFSMSFKFDFSGFGAY